MLWAAPFRAYPLAVLTSRAITVVPGAMPEMAIRPLLSVTYSPVPPSMGLPPPSVIKKVTPGRGVVVPATYFVIVMVCFGTLAKARVCVSAA